MLSLRAREVLPLLVPHLVDAVHRGQPLAAVHARSFEVMGHAVGPRIGSHLREILPALLTHLSTDWDAAPEVTQTSLAQMASVDEARAAAESVVLAIDATTIRLLLAQINKGLDLAQPPR